MHTQTLYAGGRPSDQLKVDTSELDVTQSRLSAPGLLARIASTVSSLVSSPREKAGTPTPRVGVRPTWKPPPPKPEEEESHQEAIPASSRKNYFHVFGGW